MDRISIEYRLQARLVLSTVAIVFLFLSKMAIEEIINPKTVVKLRGIILNKAEGEFFLYCCTVFSITMFIIFVTAAILTFVKREVALDNEEISVPNGPFHWAISTFKYSDILSHQILRVGKVTTLVIHHKAGKVKVPSSAFSSEEDFSLLCHSVENKRLMADI